MNNDKPVFIKRNELSQHLGSPSREDGETQSEYKSRRKRESRLLSLYMKGTPVDKKVRQNNYVDITDHI